MARADDDPGLPIKVGPCSNGEYLPVPPSPVVVEAMRRARAESERLADRLGMSRRRFLLSACGAATGLLALAACSREKAREEGRDPGGTFEVPTTATTEPEAAKEAVGGEEVVFDVQTHFLDYRDPSVTAGSFGTGFPQADCGDDDPRACFSLEHFLEEVFLRSDTTMAVVSAVPIVPEGSPLSPAVMAEAVRVIDRLCGDGRILLHSLVTPNLTETAASVAAMEQAVAQYEVAAWKAYTHFRGPEGAAPWRLDDATGEQLLRTAVELGVPRVCIHKGLSGGNPAASPDDMGPAARAHPDVDLVAYHSGYDTGVDEGPYDPARPNAGIDRLLASLDRAGVGPNQNVYAELGSTWWLLMQKPDEAAHALGKLLLRVGQDNVLWGTDSIWYGSPQDQIQAFRAFEISEQLQEQHGYPALTPDLKAKVLGGNAARLYGVDPATVTCTFSRDEIEQVRQELAAGNRTYGPTTAAEVRELAASLQGWP